MNFTYRANRSIDRGGRRPYAFLAVSLLVLFLVTETSGKSAVHPAGDFLDTLFVTPRIVVEAKRIDQSAELFNRSGFVARIDLSERNDRVEDLSALLAQVVGLRVKQYGGYGSFATVSIRGSSSSQVNVYMDGIPLNDTYTGSTSLADLPLGGIESIEVYRGFSPPHLGSSAIGGAVNLVTADAAGRGGGGAVSRLEVYESYGSFDTSRHRLSLWSQPWKLRLFAHGGWTKTLGDFTFPDDRGTPLNVYDDSLSVRANNDFDSYNFLGRCGFDIPRFGSVSVNYNRLYRDQGVPGIGTYQSSTARAKRGRSLTYLKLESKPLFSHQLKTSATAFYSKSVEQCSDLLGSVTPARQDTDNTLFAYGGLARTKWFLPLVPVSAELIFEGRREKYHPVRKTPPLREGPDRWRRSHTTVLSADLYTLRQTLVLTATQRWEKHINEFYDESPFVYLPPTPQGKIAREERTPSFGFRWHPWTFLTVKGNTGRYYRLPTFLELFGNLGSVTGESNLEPETGVNRDIGVIVTFEKAGPLRRLFFEAAYLSNEVENLILFFPNSQRTSKPTNIGAAKIDGLEFSFSSCMGPALQLSANYSLLETEDTSEIPFYRGNRLPSRPRNDLSLTASVPWRSWKLSYELHHIGANYLDRANMQEVPARNIHNAAIRFALPLDGLAFTFESRNLSDNQINDVNGFPLPGRTFFTTASYRH